MTAGPSALHDPATGQRAADLILLDPRLPTRRCAQLLEALKADPRLGRIPVVVLTGSAAAPDLCHAHQHHANAFVTKPSASSRAARATATMTAALDAAATPATPLTAPAADACGMCVQ
jgi:CheY-like chemotaxis protein